MADCSRAVHQNECETAYNKGYNFGYSQGLQAGYKMASDIAMVITKAYNKKMTLSLKEKDIHKSTEDELYEELCSTCESNLRCHEDCTHCDDYLMRAELENIDV